MLTSRCVFECPPNLVSLFSKIKIPLEVHLTYELHKNTLGKAIFLEPQSSWIGRVYISVVSEDQRKLMKTFSEL